MEFNIHENQQGHAEWRDKGNAASYRQRCALVYTKRPVWHDRFGGGKLPITLNQKW
jgi:hypothetical protein